MLSTRLPFWLRAALLAGIAGLVMIASLFAYRYYTRPVTLTVAVGSIDGEAAAAMSALASRFVSTNAPVRLKVIDTGTVQGAAKAFAAGEADLAVVRGDVGDVSKMQAVVVVTHIVALIVAPPGSSIVSMEKLKGRTVGVVGGAANARIIDVLSKEYDLVRDKVVFKDLAPADVRKAIQSKEVGALLVVVPLTQKYLSLLRGFFQVGPKMMPVLIPIESAGAIAQAERAYESFDVPKGALRGSPPVPDDDLTTLRTSLYLVASKKLGTVLISSLTEAIMSARRDLLGDQPIFAQITAPSTDADAYLPLHPGAAAFYNGTEQSFMDKYGNAIFLAPMGFGAAATLLATAWKFLGGGAPATEPGALDSLYALVRRIRKARTESELLDIEDDIDGILAAQRANATPGDAVADAATLNVVAGRLENLIRDRRHLLAKNPAIAPVVEDMRS